MANSGRRFKDAIYEQFSRIGKAVSSPKRLELLDLLCQGERTVEVLAAGTGMTVANASRHLQVLRAARLVEAEKEGVFVHYRLADQAVCELFRSMRLLAESMLAEVEQTKQRFLSARGEMEPVNRDELLGRVDPDGKERADLRLMDYLPPDQFVNRMTALKKSES